MMDYFSVSKENPVVIKISERDRKRRNLKQVAKFKVSQGLRLASGEGRGGKGLGNCKGNGVIERATKV